jgi:hypothetical protein
MSSFYSFSMDLTFFTQELSIISGIQHKMLVLADLITETFLVFERNLFASMGSCSIASY